MRVCDVFVFVLFALCTFSGNGMDAKQMTLLGEVIAENSNESDNTENIKKWLKEQNLDDYGNPTDRLYIGSSPLYDVDQKKQLSWYEFIVKKFPHRPWNEKKMLAADNQPMQAESLPTIIVYQDEQRRSMFVGKDMVIFMTEQDQNETSPPILPVARKNSQQGLGHQKKSLSSGQISLIQKLRNGVKKTWGSFSLKKKNDEQ